jgi:hypothetical protein
MGRFIFVALTNSIIGSEEAYEDWICNRHLPDVFAIPGITTAQQFKFVPSQPGINSRYNYCALYEAETNDIVAVHTAILEARGTERMPDSDTLDRDHTLAHWFHPLSQKLQRHVRGPSVGSP